MRCLARRELVLSTEKLRHACVDDGFLCRPAGHGNRSSGHHEHPYRGILGLTPEGFQVVYDMLMR